MSKNCPNLLFGSLLLIGYSMKSFKNFIIVYILFLKNPELTGLMSYYFSSLLVFFFTVFLGAFSSFPGNEPTSFV